MYKIGDLTVIWDFTAPHRANGQDLRPNLTVLHTTSGLNSGHYFRASKTLYGESSGWYAKALAGSKRPLYTVLMVELDFDYVQS